MASELGERREVDVAGDAISSKQAIPLSLDSLESAFFKVVSYD